MTTQKEQPVERAKRIGYGPSAYASAANPDFRPQRMTSQEADLRRLMAKVSAQSDSLDRRIKAMKALEARRAELAPAKPVPTPEVVTEDPAAPTSSQQDPELDTSSTSEEGAA